MASIGGFVRQYQVEVDPERLRAFNIPVTRVTQAIAAHNVDIGARVLEMGGREYMIRGLGYLEDVDDIKDVAVGATPNGTPIRVADVATVQIGPAPRRGAADLDGRGEVVAGIAGYRHAASRKVEYIGSWAVWSLRYCSTISARTASMASTSWSTSTTTDSAASSAA